MLLGAGCGTAPRRVHVVVPLGAVMEFDDAELGSAPIIGRCYKCVFVCIMEDEPAGTVPTSTVAMLLALLAAFAGDLGWAAACVALGRRGT